jgi:hypothetical protein
MFRQEEVYTNRQTLQLHPGIRLKVKRCSIPLLIRFLNALNVNSMPCSLFIFPSLQLSAELTKKAALPKCESLAAVSASKPIRARGYR